VLDVAQGLTHADQRILDGCMRRETRLLCGKRPVNKTSFLSTRLYCVGMLHALDYQQDLKRHINRTSLCRHAAQKHIYIYIYIYIYICMYISHQQDFKRPINRTSKCGQHESYQHDVSTRGILHANTNTRQRWHEFACIWKEIYTPMKKDPWTRPPHSPRRVYLSSVRMLWSGYN